MKTANKTKNSKTDAAKAGAPEEKETGRLPREEKCSFRTHSRYKPIEDYGVIGDLHTVALIAKDGSIDWCCMPHFDSPSVFGAILDASKGGFFRISPENCAVHKQIYLPETCILITRFLSPDGVGEISDFMTIEGGEEDNHLHQIVRIVKVVSGTMKFSLDCFPAFDYARAGSRMTLHSEGAVFESGNSRLGLTSRVPLHPHENGCAAEFVLKEGEAMPFILRYREKNDHRSLLDAHYDCRAAFNATIEYWRKWVKGIQYQGRWREMVQRSAMTLKLLTFAPTGAIVAAPTMGLPETIGGARNFDYRYTWIRDAAFTVYSFLKLGLTDEAEKFMNWIYARTKESSGEGELQIMYSIRGEHHLPEITLSHLEGYRESKPVRIGNAAANQLQLDIYGELMDSIYLANKYHAPISYDLWIDLRKSLDYVCNNWQRKDEGIWEVRGGRHHFVYSKLMCWVALDRGLRLSAERGLPGERAKWYAVRDQIYEEIMAKGWNAKKEHFVQHYDTEALDASNLIMPLVRFVSPTDPRMLKTLEATMRELSSDTLVHRYEQQKGADDGFTGREGSFSMCSFWLVECLAKSGRLDEARLFFEKMHSYSNHVGLYSEEIGVTGEHLGNFPQAFTHLSLISAALNLNRALGE